VSAGHVRGRGWQWLRAVLGALWLVLAVTVLTQGERRASLADLERALADSDVRVVHVVGYGLPPEGSGSARQEVHWRTGLSGHLQREHPGVTVVREAYRSDATWWGWRVPVWTDAPGARTPRPRPAPDGRVGVPAVGAARQRRAGRGLTGPVRSTAPPSCSRPACA
jgi:hypothetical protein